MKILIETMGKITKSGIGAKSQKPYIMVEAYAHLDGSKYPQLFEYYAAVQQEVLPAGFYEIPVTISIRDGRFNFFSDFQKAVRVNSRAQVKQA